uniref:Uncharacterized protein n=1 Tax=Anguilla anguilla TaxID=7936 RepID=A0A0E9QBS4_ANGAN
MKNNFLYRNKPSKEENVQEFVN